MGVVGCAVCAAGRSKGRKASPTRRLRAIGRMREPPAGTDESEGHRSGSCIASDQAHSLGGTGILIQSTSTSNMASVIICNCFGGGGAVPPPPPSLPMRAERLTDRLTLNGSVTVYCMRAAALATLDKTDFTDAACERADSLGFSSRAPLWPTGPLPRPHPPRSRSPSRARPRQALPSTSSMTAVARCSVRDRRSPAVPRGRSGTMREWAS